MRSGLDTLASGWANLAETAQEALGAPQEAVDYDLVDGRVVCTVDTVGTFKGGNCYEVALHIRNAGRQGRRFELPSPAFTAKLRDEAAQVQARA